MTNSEEPPTAPQSQNNENTTEQENLDPNEDESDEEDESIEDFDEEGKMNTEYLVT